LRQIKAKIADLEKQLQLKKNEKSILSADIDIIKSQLSAYSKLNDSD
jgi:hypothetical protein